MTSVIERVSVTTNKNGGSVMNLCRFLATIAGAVCVGLAVPASATILTATYTGTVTGTYNQYGTATPLGSDLSALVGQTFTTRYVYDTDLGYRDTYNDGAGNSFDYVYGGSYYGNTNPILSVLITFGTTTTDLSGSVLGQQYVRNLAGTSYSDSINYPNYSCSGGCAGTYLDNQASLPAGAIASPASIEDPFSWNASQGGMLTGVFMALPTMQVVTRRSIGMFS